MSRQEAVAAFLAGRISRRTLIRNLVAGGVSVGAATSYAQMLDPEEADAALPAGLGDDLYPLVTLQFKPQTLADLLSTSKVKLVGTCGEEVGLSITVYVRQGPGLRLIGSRGFPLFLTSAGTNTGDDHRGYGPAAGAHEGDPLRLRARRRQRAVRGGRDGEAEARLTGCRAAGPRALPPGAGGRTLR